jgi:hypothetical protein
MVKFEIHRYRTGRWGVSVTAADVAGRLGRLADTLAELKERVRMAVAGETGKAVGEAIRDLLTAALTGRTTPRPAYRSTRTGWDDDADRWDDESHEDRYARPVRNAWHEDDDSVPRMEPAMKSTVTWSAAFAAGTVAVRWWLARRVPGWAALGLGLVVGVAAVAGGPVARAGLTLVAAAADLVPSVHPFAEWGLLPHKI